MHCSVSGMRSYQFRSLTIAISHNEDGAMPNRILREGILTSERIAQLSWPAEVFYRRLMSVVDDFGRYHATPMLLRAACYPLGLDRVSDSDVGKWLGETRKAALVGTYQVEGKSYLELRDFRQQVRAKVSKFPSPDGHMPSKCVADDLQLLADAHLDGDVDGDGGEADQQPQFAEFWAMYPGPRKVAKAKCLAIWKLHGFEAVADQILLHVSAMKATPQWQEADGKYIPSPLTYLNQRRFEDGTPESPKPRMVI